jgi:hypothetical protein
LSAAAQICGPGALVRTIVGFNDAIQKEVDAGRGKKQLCWNNASNGSVFTKAYIA